MNKRSKVINMAESFASIKVPKELMDRATVAYVIDTKSVPTQKNVVFKALQEYIDKHSADKKETKKAS